MACKALTRRHISFLCFLCLTSCSSVQLTDAKGKTYRYFGYVEIIAPDTTSRIETVKMQALGLGVENGLLIGWQEKEQVFVPLRTSEKSDGSFDVPCSAVVIIRSNAEAQSATKLLSGLEDKNICLTSFDQRPPVSRH